MHWLVLDALDDYMGKVSNGSYVHHTKQTWNRDSSTIKEVDEESDNKSDEECDEEDGIKEAGIFDTPMKLKLGVNCIHKDVDQNDFHC